MAKQKASRSKPKKPDPTHFRVLALDGGGIRGVITATWLANLEDKLKGRIRDHVDLIAGTSTGGILACAVAKGIPASEVLNLYERRGREIFPGAPSRLWSRLGRTFTQGPSAPKYTDAGLERVLRDVLGDARFGDIPKPVLIPTYNTLMRQALVFKNSKDSHQHIPIWQIAKATASAPTYFPATVMNVEGVELPIVDGGVVANNPTACAVAEAIRMQGDAGTGKGLGDLAVVSMGTGQTTRPIRINEALEWGALEWAVPVIDVIMDGAADATEYIVSQLMPRTNYERMQARLDEAFDDMDDASVTNVNALKAVAHDHLRNEGGDEQIARIARLLAA